MPTLCSARALLAFSPPAKRATCAHDAKTVVGVVVGYSLDEACHHLAIGWFELDLHEPRCSVRRAALT